MLIVRWGSFPPEIRAAFAPILHSYLWLMPGWCRQLYVSWHLHEDNDCSASTSGEVEYRQARVFIHGSWIDGGENRRRLEVIHELLHVPLLPMSDSHDDDLERLFSDDQAPKFKETLKEQWRRALEGSVQDLAFAISMIPPEHLPSVLFIEEEDDHPPLKVAS